MDGDTPPLSPPSAPPPQAPGPSLHPPPMFAHLLLHPSLDIKGGVALVGFRYRTESHKENVVYLIATAETIQYVYDDTVTLGAQQYVVERGTRMLMPLTERVHPAALWQFVEEFTSGHVGRWLRGREVFDCLRALVQ